MPESAAPQDEIINPETGEPLDFDEARFVSLTGNQLTVYLQSEMEWFRGPDGDRRAREIGDFAVNFEQGMYPISDDQSLGYEEAKLLIENPKYGDLYKLAAKKFEVDPNEEPPGPSEPTSEQQGQPELAEDEVLIDGHVMTKEQARSYLSENEGNEMENPPEDEIEDVATEPHGQSLTNLSEPNNKTEALEALANEGVDMGDAPPADASTEEVQEFAVANGYLIEKYDMP